MSFFKPWFKTHCEGCRCFAPVSFTQPEEDSSDEDFLSDDDEEEERELPLANEPDAQSPPHTHEWSLWDIVKEGSITVTGDWGVERTIGTYLDQRRRCDTCGKYELDTQVSYAVEE